MASTYEYVSALADYISAKVVKNEDEWKKNLSFASRLYKYPFKEQILIMDLGHFDGWASTFGKTQTTIDIACQL